VPNPNRTAAGFIAGVPCPGRAAPRRSKRTQSAVARGCPRWLRARRPRLLWARLRSSCLSQENQTNPIPPPAHGNPPAGPFPNTRAKRTQSTHNQNKKEPLAPFTKRTQSPPQDSLSTPSVPNAVSETGMAPRRASAFFLLTANHNLQYYNHRLRYETR
jgi:hypothetical protein